MPLLSLNPNEIRDFVDHAAHGRRVFHLNAVPNATKPEAMYAGNVLL